MKRFRPIAYLAAILIVLMVLPSFTSCNKGSRVVVYDKQRFMYNNRYSNDSRKKRYYRQKKVVKKIVKQSEE